jgi:hypothetical protein
MGMSPVALAGSLGGSGTFTLEKGLPIDTVRVRDRTLAEGAITINAGQAPHQSHHRPRGHLQ